jgi:transcriptional regulator with XRE-family HTH domain
MLTTMTEAATLIKEAREDSGLSLRALADLADVSFTTISRIEHGQTDPTIGTLRKVLGALGEDLDLARQPAPEVPQLAALSDAWSTDLLGQHQPDWTRLRTFLDYLARHDELAPLAVRARPPATGSEFFDNLLAGIAEKVADDAQAQRPAWTRRIHGLSERWESDGTPRMRAMSEATTPPQLAARNLVLSATSLWRDAAG